MLIKSIKTSDAVMADVTAEKDYLNRRTFIKGAAGLGLTASLPSYATAAPRPLNGLMRNGAYWLDEKPTPYKAVSTYNNFYEFGTGKDDPAENAHTLKTRPWTVRIDGHVEKPGDYDLDDLLGGITMEERLYRMRCVEAWSMVIPWAGVPLAGLIKKLGPTSKAKYIRFETLHDVAQMPGQKRRVIHWPYVEGLRMDEAMHPLSFMATGLYGKTLPNQNGAPLRLVVPWKYGFKGVKSIVRISFVEKMPHNSWRRLAPNEYGFYANVNPAVDHPRWSQASERRIGEFRRRETLMFNGYADEVAHLYQGLDLKKNY